eukprot:TRINITY_DN4755_c0_g2_i1.p1 TRINITY_DN4755_c0_g2~~TRINITY_DN4755_c0_g2_i1.p1  ORF type:complete len:476 (+),score=196.57 TRINITY_DN4755_c0_g2_i1:97-1524(+)
MGQGDVVLEADQPPGGSGHVVYKTRWYVLGVFSVLSTQQTLMWMTFSPIADSTRTYFGTTDNVINLQLAYGCIFFVPFVVVVSWLLGRSDQGLRQVMLLGAVLDGLGGAIRVLAIMHPRAWYSMWFISIGQILNALVGPISMASCPKLSSIWFPPDERTTATALASLAGNVGSAAGFLIPPYVLLYFSMEALIIGQAVEAVAMMVLILAYFPAKPPTPPSATAVVPPKTTKQLWREAVDALKNPSFVLIVIIGGGAGGIYNIWSSMPDLILSPLGISQTWAGWLGFGMTVSGIVGGIGVGRLGDTVFKGRFKLLLILMYSMCTASFVYLTLSLPSLFSPKALLPTNRWVVLVACTCAGLFQGAAGPLFYEFAAELTYPVPEGTTAGLITMMNNVACLAVIGVSPYIPLLWLNCVMTIAVAIATVLLGFIREDYRRSRLDQAADAKDAVPTSRESERLLPPPADSERTEWDRLHIN